MVGNNYGESPDDFTVCVSYPPANVDEMSNNEIIGFLSETIVIRKGSNIQGVASGEINPFTRLRVVEDNDLLNRDLNREINDIRGWPDYNPSNFPVLGG